MKKKQDFTRHLEAINVAFEKMKEFDSKPESKGSSKQLPIVINCYQFENPRSFELFNKKTTSSFVEILLIKFGIQVAFEGKKISFSFEIKEKVDEKIIKLLIQLDNNKILPEAILFKEVFPLRSIEVAEYFTQGHLWGCDD